MPAHAQKIPVEVTHDGRDNIGRQFAFEVRGCASEVPTAFEWLRANRRNRASWFQLFHYQSKTLTIGVPRLSVSKTVDADTIPVNGLYITTGVRIVGANRVKDQCRRVTGTRSMRQSTFFVAKWPAVYKMLVPAGQ